MQEEVRSQIDLKGSQKPQNTNYQSDNKNQIRDEEILDGSEDQRNQKTHDKIKTMKSLTQKSEELQEDQVKLSPTSQTRSVFHNFQKHLVITLRQSIKIKKSSHKKQPQFVACQIWQNFVKQSKIYTKNILHIVFGVVDYEGSDLNNIYDQDIIQKFGYSEIFAQYSDLLITEAQQYLRTQVINQLKQCDFKVVMKKRRLGNIDELVEYVLQFISELEEGPMRKRLPKNKKVQMKLKKSNTEQ